MISVLLWLAVVIPVSLLVALVIGAALNALSKTQKKFVVPCTVQTANDTPHIADEQYWRMHWLIDCRPVERNLNTRVRSYYSNKVVTHFYEYFTTYGPKCLEKEEYDYVVDFIATGNHNFLFERDRAKRIVKKFHARLEVLQDD